MIDLDQAAQELTASVAHVQPDLPRVQGIARRRQHRRRAVVAATAVLVLLAGGAAALAATGGDDGEQVRAGQTTTATTTDAGDLVDYGDLRITIPDGWTAVMTGQVPDGACDGPGLVLVGPEVELPAACRALPSVQIQNGASAPGQGGSVETRTENGVQLEQGEPSDDAIQWAAPDLNATLTFRNGADPELVLPTVVESGRKVALDDVAAGGQPDWPDRPNEWRTVSFRGVTVDVPNDWPVGAHRSPGLEGSDDPCVGWTAGTPSVVLGSVGNPRCTTSGWTPGDGVWILPLEGTGIERDPQMDTSIVTSGTGTDGTEGDLVWDTLGLIQVVVSSGNGSDVLVRVDAGVEGHLAGSILSSLRIAADPSITLPCGPVVADDREDLDIPSDLDVSLLEGLGGTGSPEGCAVNLTATDNPGRHITFVDGSLPYGLGDDEQTVDGLRSVRWGTIEDGYGAELLASGKHQEDDQISILAYGVSQEEFAGLIQSLAKTG